MLITLLLIAIATTGGFAVSCLIEEDEPFLWRVAAGNIIGCAAFGTFGFVLTLGFGLNPAVVVAAVLIALSPVLAFYNEDRRRKLRQDWSRAKDRMQGTSAKRFLRLAYYVFFFLLFFFFFDRAMLESAAGIFTGGSQNLGDLPFHLGAIYSFTETNNFPPENPSFAGARFSYPFIADLLTAFAVKLGAGARDAMFVQNLFWAFSLLVILERFVFKLTGDRLAARIAPALLFFSGGLGFVWFLGDYWSQSKSFFDFLAHLPKDYTIGDGFRWGNSMVVLFMTQRSLLLGMPLTLIVLGYLWRKFATTTPSGTTPSAQSGGHPSSNQEGSAAATPPKTGGEFFSASPLLRVSASLLVGLLAGLLSLIHLHSLVVLFVVGVFLFVLKPELWVTWVVFAAGVAVTAIPELAWSMAGSASQTSKFFAWHFGWDKGERNFFWFWFTNTGMFIPLLLAGVYLAVFRTKPDDADVFPQSRKGAKKAIRKEKSTADEREDSPFTIHHSPLIWFYLPFAFLFVVSNIAKLAPWEWDNIKVLIYWFVGSLPFVAVAIAWAWRKQTWLRALAAVCFVVLTASGALDVWRVVSGQINYKVFDTDAVEIAEQIKRRTPPDAIFLNAPTYNTAVVLTGRQSLMRYPGHLASHGIDYGTRESELKRIYQGSPDAAALIGKYGIQYVVVSPEERNAGGVNDQFFSRFPIAAESGQYRVYRIK